MRRTPEVTAGRGRCGASVAPPARAGAGGRRRAPSAPCGLRSGRRRGPGVLAVMLLVWALTAAAGGPA
ncbi:hypothetical protein, partial [Streptomyces sp. NRRL WC-3549]|uniref:hypothetical protein n=1 Tax=Streptomyces sp. NRRL WC-3549 TaxID=1463925 RepID=UPI001F21BE11